VSPSEWRWAIVWLVLGSGQMFGATLSFVLRAETGMTRWSLGAAVGTSLLTTLSLSSLSALGSKDRSFSPRGDAHRTRRIGAHH
jgi:hypothetical protein